MKYIGNTYYLIDRLFYLFIYAGLVVVIIYFYNEIGIVRVGGLLLILILTILFFNTISKLAKLEFNEKNITVKYKFPNNRKNIEYSSITEIHHITGYRVASLNIIKFKQRNGQKNDKIKITNIVPNDEFLQFVKWIKTKNEHIEFKFFPSDSKMKDDFKKEFTDE